MQGNEQGGLVIHSLFKVYEQMSFRTGIEVDSSFLVSFAVDHTFACIEVDITTIQLHQLVDVNKSIIARSRASLQESRSCSSDSSEYTGFNVLEVLIFLILRTGLL